MWFYLHAHQEQLWWLYEERFPFRNSSSWVSQPVSTLHEFLIFRPPSVPALEQSVPSLGHSPTRRHPTQDTVFSNFRQPQHILSLTPSVLNLLDWPLGRVIVCPSQGTSGHTLAIIRGWHLSFLGSLKDGNLHFREWVVYLWKWLREKHIREASWICTRKNATGPWVCPSGMSAATAPVLSHFFCSTLLFASLYFLSLSPAYTRSLMRAGPCFAHDRAHSTELDLL